MLNSIILALTGACLVFGVILGLMRGFSRAFIRFILMCASVAGAWFLREFIAEKVMTLDIGGKNLEQFIAEAMSSSEIPSSVVNLVQSFAKILIGVAVFLLAFLLLKTVTLVIVFPILKLIFGRKKKLRLIGLIIGALQGALVAFVLCVPISGLMLQYDKLADIEIDGKKVIEKSVDFNVDEYKDSLLGRFYINAGGGLFEKMTTTTTADNKSITLDSVTDAVVVAVNISNEISAITNALEQNENISDSAGSIAESFRNIDQLKGDMTEETAELLNDVLRDTAASLGGQDFNLPDDFDIQQVNFTAAGNAIEAVGNYSGGAELTQENVDTIVNGLAENEIIVDALGSSSVVTVSESDRGMFEEAINNSEITDEHKEKIRVLLGLTA